MVAKPLFTAESLRDVIDRGEGQYVEFKGTWSCESATREPVGKTKLRATVAEYVAAFANADGGTLLIGVEDDGTPTGHGLSAADVGHLIAVPERRLRSPLRCDHKILAIDGHEILIIEVGRAPRAVMVDGDGFPYRTGDRVIAESEERINALKLEYQDRGFEQRLAAATLDDVDVGLLPDAAVDPAWLSRRGLVLARHGSPAVTNAAVLLAGRQPVVRWHPRQSLRVFRVDGVERQHGARRNVTEVALLELPIAELIPAAHEVLRGQIRRSEKLHDLFFREMPEYPTFAWQEAIINAVGHREYADRGRGVEVWLYADRMEVLSPGGPVQPVTIEALRERLGTHASRNPMIARVLVDLGLMREEGEGILRMFDEMERSFLHEPELDLTGDGRFRVVLRNTPIFASADPAWNHLVQRLAIRDEARRVLHAHPEGFTNEQYRELNDVDRDEAYRQIQELVAAGVVMPAGRPGRGALYRLSPDLLETRSWLQQRLPAVREHLAGHDRLTNADYRRIFGVTRYVAVGELQRLVEEGILERRGQRRGAHYVAGARLESEE
jgi:ATP-dependent DNA helicase RecG